MSDVVERAKAALEGVTRGPWRVGKRKWIGVVLTPHGCVWNPNRGEVNNPRDGEFIAQARTLVPELVDEVEELQATLFLIQEARIDYDAALRRREHGAVAADRFMSTVFRALDAEAKR